MKYRFKRFQHGNNYKEPDYIPNNHKHWVKEIMDEFDLGEGGANFSPEMVYRFWSEYSDNMCATWICPDKLAVEEVFSIILDEEE